MAQTKQSEKVAKTTKKAANQPIAHAVGRRKNAVARVWLRKGNGNIRVNGIDFKSYFDTKISADNAAMAFAACPVGVNFDVKVNVVGGGKRGQSDAVKLAIARAFVRQDETLRPVLRQHNLLTVDSRIKERKKYGQRGARRKFQFVKR